MGSSRRCNTEHMYRYIEIMTIDCITTYLMGRIIYKIYHNEVLDILINCSHTITIYTIITHYLAICICH